MYLVFHLKRFSKINSSPADLHKPWMLTILILLAIISLVTPSTIYLSPNQTCSKNCSGDFSDPSNDFLSALQKACQSNNTTLVLLSGPSLSHYVLNNDGTSSTGTLESQASTSEFTCNNLLIQPLFCTDEIVRLHPGELSDKCIDSSDKLKIYMKTTEFTISILETVTIKNIIFDAVEDIKHINDKSIALSECLSSRKRCCQEGETFSSLYPGDVVRCALSGNYSSLSLSANTSLFQIGNASEQTSSTITLNLEDVIFQNFLSPHLQSLIVIEAEENFSVQLRQTVMNRVYFNKGVISYQPQVTISSTSPNNSYIILNGSSLTNYNIWSLQLQDPARTEGYLFSADSLFSGTLSITNSTFANATSSLRDICWPQTTTYYDLPMNNRLTSEPNSRSNLWSHYHVNRGRNDFVSSLIYINQLYGEVTISTTSFTNIIGTTGSVLRIDDTPSYNTLITVNGSTFDSNFAYDSFANIVVRKASDPNFSSMLGCPSIQLNQSTFTNSYGCPGSYGNVLYLCYWDNSPPSQNSLSDYSLPDDASQFSTSWTSMNESEAIVQVTECNFTKNLLSVSNSLAVIGSYYSTLNGNTFQANGGTTAEIAEYSLTRSYFLSRYPDAMTLISEMIHFGQSTAVYFDHVIRLISENNTYTSNWGPWEGSLALGLSLTIKNWITINDGLLFINDKFTDHQDIPSSFSSNISSQAIANGTYSSPLFTLSIDIDGSNAIASALPEMNLQEPVGIQLNEIQFINNTVSYDHTSYDYNAVELDYILYEVMPGNVRYQTGLIKLLSASESTDNVEHGYRDDIETVNKASFLYSGGLISQNKLLSSGCLFTSVLLIDSVHITSNEVYLAGETFFQSPSVQDSYLMPVSTTDQGLFCIGAPGFVGPLSRLQLTANNLLIKDNLGIIINVFITTQGRSYITNSIFINNICVSLSTVSIRDTGTLFAYNNIYANNNNSAANILIYSGGKVMSVSNVYLKNTGKYASLIYMESVVAVYEVLAKAQDNTIEPDYKVFIECGSPQAGLYLVSYSPFTILASEYKRNNGYSGIVASYSTLR